MERPRTPLPMSYSDSLLLTPPPTGPFNRLAQSDNDLCTPSSKRRTKLEGESPASYFEDFNEGEASIEIEVSDVDTNPSISDSPPSSPAPSALFAANTETLEKNELFTSSSAASVIAGPFFFMKLPISIRKKVYEHLLVIPALICVRQKHIISHDHDGQGHTQLHAERRELIPGIAYALAQLTVNGYKARFSRFASTNGNILLANKEVYAEAKAVLYSKNNFEVIKPSFELNPPCNFSVRLFPPGCQRLVTSLNIRIRSFYDLHWLFSGGYNVVKNYYRGLITLTLILELESTSKGFGKQWAKTSSESSASYTKRLQAEIAKANSGAVELKKVTRIPAWIHLRVMFGGETYDEGSRGTNTASEDMIKRDELRSALTDAWEMFRKVGC